MTITMHQQDCLEGLRDLADGSVKVVVTSPPYNIGVKYGLYTDQRDDYLEWLTSVWTEVYRVLDQDGHFFLQVGGINKYPMRPFEILPTASMFCMQNLIVWVKSIAIEGVTTGHFKPINSGRYINPTNEYIFHLTKGGKTPVNRLAIGVPYMDKSNQKRWESAKAVRCQGNSWFIPYDTIQSRSRERGNHPATFPLELPLRCMKLAGMTENDTVLDPFAGIGTTLRAAVLLNCNGIGFEIDPTYVEVYNELV